MMNRWMTRLLALVMATTVLAIPGPAAADPEPPVLPGLDGELVTDLLAEPDGEPVTEPLADPAEPVVVTGIDANAELELDANILADIAGETTPTDDALIDPMADSVALMADQQLANSGTLRWLNLGDSYSAGERMGAGSGCSRTSNAFSDQAAHLLRGRGYSIDYRNYACTGAEISPTIPGNVNTSLDITRQVNSYIAAVRPDVLTLTAGGNDIGFGKVLTLCMEGYAECPSVEAMPYQGGSSPYGGRMDWAKIKRELVDFYTLTSKNMHKANRDGRVYVLSYPVLFDEKGSLNRGGRYSCIYLINKGEVLRLNAAATLLGDYIKSAVDQANTANRAAGRNEIVFVDWRPSTITTRSVPEPLYKRFFWWVFEHHNHRVAFDVNGLCADTVGQRLHVIPPTVSNLRQDAGATFHPNRLGHRVAADRLVSKFLAVQG